MLNFAEILPKAGFQVPRSYVERHFNNEDFVESRLCDKNPLYLNREHGNAINLSEYNGKLKRFFEPPEKYNFYALFDYQNYTDGDENEIAMKVKNLRALEIEQRGEAIRNKTVLYFEKICIYACLNDYSQT